MCYYLIFSGELYTKILYTAYINDAIVNPRFETVYWTNGVLPWPYNNTQYEVVDAVAEIPFASTFSLYLNAQPGFTDNNALITVLESSWAEINNGRS